VIAAVVPFKKLETTKSRLRPAVGDATGRLTLAMLGDVLSALLGVPELSRVVVVTPDRDIAEVAREAGADALVRPDPGLNAAIDGAAAELRARTLLTVLGDVPGARCEELSQLLAAAPAHGVALAPSRDGGTSALVRTPPDVIAGCFGPESARRHEDAAAEAGVDFRALPLPSLAIDVDEAADLDALLESGAPAPRTRALLRALGWPRA
jgi:2-phospho-L-lactate guanylyltransferase